MSRGKSAAGAGLQIALERKGRLAIGEGGYYDKFPRAVFPGMRTMPCIVVREALFDVFGETNVVLCCV